MKNHLTAWLIAGASVLIGLWLLSDILFPFVLGLVTGYVLDPVCDRMERRGLSRTTATAIVVGAFIIVLTLVFAIAVPLAWSQTVQLLDRLPGMQQQAETFIQPHWEQVAPYLTPEVVNRIEGAAQSYAGTAAALIASGLKAALDGSLAAFDLVTTLLITPLVAFYLIRDWDRLIEQVDRRIPRPAVDIVRARAREIDQTLSAWMRGVGTVCLILAIYYSMSLSIIGLSYGIVIGLVAGVISFIPFVGFFAGGLLAMVSALFTFDSEIMWLVTLGIFVIGQIAEGNFLTPRLVGRSVNLHEVWIMFALMAGGQLLGFTGVLIAIPVAAVIGVLIQAGDAWYQKSTLFSPREE